MNNSQGAKKKKILVIDDNAGILFAMRMALEMEGYEVRVAEIFEGVEAIEKNPPSLILLDFFLLNEDGNQVLQKLKSYENTKKIPVIIVSAANNIEDRAKDARAGGASDYLSKPFKLADLFRKVAKYSQ